MNPGRRTLRRKPFLFCLTLALVVTVLAQARQQDRYYIFNGKTLQATDGNPVVASTARWQVWLFEEGVRIPSPAAGLQYSRWGLIEADSAENVMRRLRNSQSFEQAYLKFFGPGTWGRYSFINPVGPIAVTGQALEDQPGTLEKLYQVRWLADQVDKLIAAIQPSLENNEGDPASPLRGYFDEFRNAQQQVCKLHNGLSRNHSGLRFISNGIARAKAEITNAENNVPKITSVLPSVKLPASKAWMLHAERGGSDGTIQVEVTETEGGVSVQKTWTGGDGSMAGTLIVTMIPHADVGKVDLELPPRNGDEWKVRVQSATGSFPQIVTSPQRKTSRRTFPAVNYTTTQSSAYFVFTSSSQAQDAYAYFLYHKQFGRYE